MQLQHNSNTWYVNIKRHHLHTLICAAKWIMNGQKGRIPRQAKSQLKKIVNSYDAECNRVYKNTPELLFSEPKEQQTKESTTK